MAYLIELSSVQMACHSAPSILSLKLNQFNAKIEEQITKRLLILMATQGSSRETTF